MFHYRPMLSNSSDGVMVWQNLYKTLCKKHVVAAYESHYLCGSHGRNSDYGGKTVLLKSIFKRKWAVSIIPLDNNYWRESTLLLHTIITPSIHVRINPALHIPHPHLWRESSWESPSIWCPKQGQNFPSLTLPLHFPFVSFSYLLFSSLLFFMYVIIFSFIN